MCAEPKPEHQILLYSVFVPCSWRVLEHPWECCVDRQERKIKASFRTSENLGTRHQQAAVSYHDVVAFSLFCFTVCEERKKRHLDTIRSMEYWLGELKESLLYLPSYNSQRF